MVAISPRLDRVTTQAEKRGGAWCTSKLPQQSGTLVSTKIELGGPDVWPLL
jgi:hypothetical protein